MLKQYILTFEAIGAVRGELARAESVGDTAAALDAYTRLTSLYASIDADSIVSAMKQASGDNVLVGNFKANRKAG